MIDFIKSVCWSVSKIVFVALIGSLFGYAAAQKELREYDEPFQFGVDSRQADVPAEANPCSMFSETRRRRAWLDGWIDAAEGDVNER